MPCSCKSGQRTALQLFDKVKENDTTYTFDFVPIEPLGWKEGDSSAVVVNVASVGMEDSRKLSYATMPSEKVIRFTTRITEEPSLFKEEMLSLNKGDFVEITYPEGQFDLVREGRPAMLLSNGVGIAAIRALVIAFHENPHQIDHMTQINVDRSGCIYREEFETISKTNSHFTSHYAKHRDDFYGLLEDEARQLMFTNGRMPYFYVVGSDSFVEEVTFYLYGIGFEESDILTDQQGCGCGSTKLKTVKAKGKVQMNRSIHLKAD